MRESSGLKQNHVVLSTSKKKYCAKFYDREISQTIFILNNFQLMKQKRSIWKTFPHAKRDFCSILKILYTFDRRRILIKMIFGHMYAVAIDLRRCRLILCSHGCLKILNIFQWLCRNPMTNSEKVVLFLYETDGFVQHIYRN